MPIAPALPLDAASAQLDDPNEGRLPAGVYAIIGVLALLGGVLTPNGALTAASLVVLGLLAWLLWRPGEPPVLLFAVAYQWLQATAKVFQADAQGLYVETLSASPSIAAATWLSLAGLVVLAVGMQIGIRRLPALQDRIRESASTISLSKAFWLYAVFAVVAIAMVRLGYAFGPLRQILLAVAELKWAGFFLLSYLVFSRKSGFLFFATAFAFEFIGGIGFFSGFKTVFFVTLIAVLAARPRITMGTATLGLSAVLVLLLFGSAWTVVKPQYRSILSGGRASQSSTLNQAGEVGTLFTLVASLSWNDLMDGMDPLFRRIAYTDFFAAAMDYVPAHRPYDGGALWGTAIKHVLTPRILFPSKPRLLSDSEVTMTYTGLYMASDAEGTSISIGYMGESYADFGPVGMFGVIFALGLGWGLMYAHFVRRAHVPILGLAVALSVLLSAYQFEIASIKLLGGVLMKFLVLAVLFHFFERRVARWLGATEPESVFEEDDEGAPDESVGVLARAL